MCVCVCVCVCACVCAFLRPRTICLNTPRRPNSTPRPTSPHDLFTNYNTYPTRCITLVAKASLRPRAICPAHRARAYTQTHGHTPHTQTHTDTRHIVAASATLLFPPPLSAPAPLPPRRPAALPPRRTATIPVRPFLIACSACRGSAWQRPSRR